MKNLLLGVSAAVLFIVSGAYVFDDGRAFLPGIAGALLVSVLVVRANR